MMKLWCYLQILKKRPEYYLLQETVQNILKRINFSQLNVEAEFLDLLSQSSESLAEDLFVACRDEHTLASEWSLAKEKGYEFVIYGDKKYPKALYKMIDPPLVLSFYGVLPQLNQNCLSVVGSREPRRESFAWMDQELGHFLKAHEVIVVSGGARGIDSRAHDLAIRYNRPTIVILPSGLDCLYPHQLKEKVAPIIECGGCLMSEYSYSLRMRKHQFHHRNRIIAGLSLATLIVEAKLKSGTLMTAHLSAEIGRPLWVVPGHPQDLFFQGSLELISEGATMVKDAQDLALHFLIESEFVNLPQ